MGSEPSRRPRPAGAARARHLRVVDAETAQAHEEQAIESAKEDALRLLATRPLTRVQLTRGLARRGVDESVVVEVVRRLGAVGLLDDRALAEAYAEREAGRKGPRALVKALERRGVDRSVAHSVVNARSIEDVRASAQELARQKLAGWRGLDHAVVRRRLVGLLTRRGYPAGIVHAVVREAVGDAAAVDLKAVDYAEAQIWAESEPD